MLTTEQVKNLIAMVTDHCIKNKIKLNLDFNSSHIDMAGSMVNGYFSDEIDGDYESILAVGCGKDSSLWAPILLHEYCHSCQWVENKFWFQKASESIGEFFEWVDGVAEGSVDPEPLMKISLQVESDCEARVIKLINELGFANEITTDTYAQRANSYITFYKYILLTKKWYKAGKEPYNQESVWSLFPQTIDLDGSELTPERMAAYDGCVED